MWIALSIIELWEFFMRSDTSSLSNRGCANVFSHSMCSLFTFWWCYLNHKGCITEKKSLFSLNIDMMLNRIIGGRNTLAVILGLFNINLRQVRNVVFNDCALVKDHWNDRVDILKYLERVFTSAIVHHIYFFSVNTLR